MYIYCCNYVVTVQGKYIYIDRSVYGICSGLYLTNGSAKDPRKALGKVRSVRPQNSGSYIVYTERSDAMLLTLQMVIGTYRVSTRVVLSS